MAGRKQLPLPDGIAPSRRPPPPTPVYDESPPPPLPNRPTPSRATPASTNRNLPKLPPQRPPSPDEQVYDEGEPGEIYDEAEMGGAVEEEEQETYDDMEVGESAEAPQEMYADCDVEEEAPQESYDEFGGIAQDTYEIEPEEPQEEYQECEIGSAVQDGEELYQVADDGAPSPPPPPVAAPSLPPPRPKQKKDSDGAPPPPVSRNAEKKAVSKLPGPGLPAIGMGDIQNIKDRLKKVTVARNEPGDKKEPKLYTDSNELKSKFDFFKQKEKDALAMGNKPDITPKPIGLNVRKSTPIKADSPALPSRPSDKSPSQRNASDSLPPVPSARDQKPPPPPPVTEIPRQTPDLPPPRGRDGYTKVSVTEAEQNHNGEEDFDQEIYDDAISFEDPLMKERWYFGEIDRLVGNDKLKKLGVNGSYLLRKSTKGGDKQPYTLMVMYKNHIYNLKIRERNDGRMALGEEKPDEMTFKSVVDLINHHQQNDVILVHKDGKQDTTTLIRSPPK